MESDEEGNPVYLLPQGLYIVFRRIRLSTGLLAFVDTHCTTRAVRVERPATLAILYEQNPG